MDSFGKAGTFSKVLKKLLESYALDAIDQFNPQKEIKVHRLESQKLNGFALALEGDLLHCSIFAKISSENRIGARSRMARFSNRSGNSG